MAAGRRRAAPTLCVRTAARRHCSRRPRRSSARPPLVVGVFLAVAVASAGVQPVWYALVIFPLFHYRSEMHCPWGDVNILTAWNARFTFPLVLKYLPVALLASAGRLAWLWRARRDLPRAQALLLLLIFSGASAAVDRLLPRLHQNLVHRLRVPDRGGREPRVGGAAVSGAAAPGQRVGWLAGRRGLLVASGRQSVRQPAAAAPRVPGVACNRVRPRRLSHPGRSDGCAMGSRRCWPKRRRAICTPTRFLRIST